MYRRWTEFVGSPNKYRKDSPHVTLSPKGVILMNHVAHASFGSPEWVKLFYDRQNCAIGLKPTGPDADNAFPVKNKGKNANLLIHAKPFIVDLSLETPKTIVFHGVEVDDDMLVLDLTRTTAAVSRAKKPAAKE
ncbi:MAG: hypothetical protein ABL999_12220 [Pyrinomonadaceae bacterium]